MTVTTPTFTDLQELQQHAQDAANLLKQMSNEHRLMILCALGQQEYSAGELNALVPLSQSALSQHLASLRRAELVTTRKASQTVYYNFHRLNDGSLQLLPAKHHKPFTTVYKAMLRCALLMYCERFIVPIINHPLPVEKQHELFQ